MSGAAILFTAVRDNVAALDQAAKLLASFDSQAYARRHSVCFHSSAGGHVRHVLEHYRSFLRGVATGLVNYEARARDERLENEPELATEALQSIQKELLSFAERGENRRLRLRAEAAEAQAAEPWADSCALRELEFLLSHTIHHFALIGVICAIVAHSPPLMWWPPEQTTLPWRCVQ